MLTAAAGAIVNTASTPDRSGLQRPSITSRQHGVVGLTKTAVIEYARTASA